MHAPVCSTGFRSTVDSSSAPNALPALLPRADPDRVPREGFSEEGSAIVSRAQHTTGRKVLAAALGLGVAALFAAGCGAGQITQTNAQQPAANGSIGQAGPMAVRNVTLAYPADRRYRVGDSAPLVAIIANTGQQDDELVSITSPVAASVVFTPDGPVEIPALRALEVGKAGEVATRVTPTPTTTSAGAPTSVSGSAPASGSTSVSRSSSVAPTSSPSAAPSTSAAPAELGRLRVVLTGLTEELVPGKTIAITFTFRDAGSVTIQVPIANPATARPEPTEAQE